MVPKRSPGGEPWRYAPDDLATRRQVARSPGLRSRSGGTPEPTARESGHLKPVLAGSPYG